MSTMNIIRRKMKSVWTEMHATRARALLATVEAVVGGGRLGLTATGRLLRSKTSQRHGIKRVDRLLGNKHLHSELPAIYAGAMAMVLGDHGRPTVLVDWTDVKSDRVALVAALPAMGRAIPIYAEVHTIDQLGNAGVEAAFLATLHDKIIPRWCRPVIVTDAGYRNHWFKAVVDLGWDYVGRVCSNPLAIAASAPADLKADRQAWVTIKSMHGRANGVARALGHWTVAKTNPLDTRLVAYKGPPKGRQASRKVDGRGVHPGSSAWKKYKQRASEPWVLATSLDAPAAEVVQHYATRMRIEESFRDMKNHRFGWSFNHARCRMPVPLDEPEAVEKNAKGSRRLEVLLVVAALGMIVVSLIGLALEQAGAHLDYQANTITVRRVLSLFVLGSLAVQSRSEIRIDPSPKLLGKALETLRDAVGNPKILAGSTS